MRSEPAVAMRPDGGFIIVWNSANQDGSQDGVYAQRFGATGVPLSRPTDAFAGTYANPHEFRVNRTTAALQRQPAVAIRDDNSFVIAWEASNTTVGFVTHEAMYQSFNADGTRVGTANDRYADADNLDLEQRRVALTGGPAAGNVIIAWQYDNGAGEQEIRLREIRANGSLGAMKAINAPGGILGNPQLDMNASGAYAVVFESDIGGGSIGVVRLDSAGNSLDGGVALTVNQRVVSGAAWPGVAVADDGRVLALWEAHDTTGPGRDIAAREIAADGRVAANETVVSAIVAGIKWCMGSPVRPIPATMRCPRGRST
ncbi:MAG: hypothetical protein R3E68_01735 [Burkholderiaceae bacterium]